jgi:hypothetical protein
MPPVAVPNAGATALAVVPRALFKSIIPAPTAPSAAPVANPWMIRASTRSPTPLAVANITMVTVCRAMAATSTGRRPRWSDNLPTKSNAANTETA